VSGLESGLESEPGSALVLVPVLVQA